MSIEIFGHWSYTGKFTGKIFSEVHILASVNPQYDNKLFIELRVQYEKNTSSEHVVYKNCLVGQNKNNKQFLHTTCSELVFFHTEVVNQWTISCHIAG